MATFAAKKAIWLRILLTEIGLLDKEGQYVEIIVAKGSKGEEQIKANAEWQEGKAPSMILISNAAPIAPASLPPLASNDFSLLVSLQRDN